MLFPVRFILILLIACIIPNTLAQETDPIYITNKSTVVDVFSLPSSYDNRIRIFTYFDTLHVVAGGAGAEKYALDHKLPGSNLSFQNTKQGMIVSYNSGTIYSSFEKISSSGNISIAYFEVIFNLFTPDIPYFRISGKPVCPGSPFTIEAVSEWASAYDYECSNPEYIIGSTIHIPENIATDEEILFRARASNYHGRSEWSSWRRLPVALQMPDMKIQGQTYLIPETDYTFTITDTEGSDIEPDSNTSFDWSFISPANNKTDIENNSKAIVFRAPPDYGYIECLVTNENACKDINLKKQLIVLRNTGIFPEIAVLNEYKITGSAVPLYLQNTENDKQPEQWYIDDNPIQPEEGVFYINPSKLSIGLHRIKARLDNGDDSYINIEAWFSIGE